MKVILRDLLGLAVLVACNAGLWWVAHRMAWWTYALLVSVAFILWVFVSIFVKEVRQ